MNYFIFIIPFVIITYLLTVFFSGYISVNIIHEKLWSDIEHQLEELSKKQELQAIEIIGLKELLNKKGINITQNQFINDENDNEPNARDILNNIKNDFELLKYYYTRGKTTNNPKYEFPQKTNSYSANIRSYENLPTNYSEEYCTVGGAAYEFINITGTEFRFKLRAPSNGYIALAYRPFEVQPMYELILGASANTESFIRKNNIVVASISHGSLLKGCDYMGFWIRWNDSVISVGYESDIRPLLQYNATDLYKVNYIGLRTHSDVANWIIY